LNTVIDLGFLVEGLTYTLMLSVLGVADAGSTSVTGYASIEIVVNTPPTSGTFSVSPSSGVAMSTVFEMECSSWVDEPDDYPLRYQMKAAIGATAAQLTSQDATESILSPQSNSPYFTSVLPLGDSSNEELSLIAYITDVYEGFARSTAVVQVTSLASDYISGQRRSLLSEDNQEASFVKFMQNLTLSLLEPPAIIGDFQTVVVRARNLASLLNSPETKGISLDSQRPLISSLVMMISKSSSIMEKSQENLDIIMTSLESVSNNDISRMDDEAQSRSLELAYEWLSARLAIASKAACITLSTLLSSDFLLYQSVNRSLNTELLHQSLNNYGSGTLVNRFAGMAASEFSCSGLSIRSQKLESQDFLGGTEISGYF
jgi:hypothetical protein